MGTDYLADIDEAVSAPQLPEPKNYLCWDQDCGWRIYGIDDIKQAVEHHAYSGFGQPTKIFVLDDETGELDAVTLTFIDNREDDRDYQYSRYRVGVGADAEYFTVGIDLRA